MSRHTHRHHHHHHTITTVPRSHQHRGIFQCVNPNRRAGGLKAAVYNPNTSSKGRRSAKHELRVMDRGRDAHVPLLVRIKRMLGIHSHRKHHNRDMVISY